MNYYKKIQFIVLVLSCFGSVSLEAICGKGMVDKDTFLGKLSPAMYKNISCQEYKEYEKDALELFENANKKDEKTGKKTHEFSIEKIADIAGACTFYPVTVTGAILKNLEDREGEKITAFHHYLPELIKFSSSREELMKEYEKNSTHYTKNDLLIALAARNPEAFKAYKIIELLLMSDTILSEYCLYNCGIYGGFHMGNFLIPISPEEEKYLLCYPYFGQRYVLLGRTLDLLENNKRFKSRLERRFS
jgi:hypothetical protein